MVLYFRMDGDRIAQVSFQTYGCGAMIACGSVLTEIIAQRSIAECVALTADDVVSALDGVPADKLHCPAMAIAALRAGLTSE